MENRAVDLPIYKSHKEVRAFKIMRIDKIDTYRALLIGDFLIEVGANYKGKHKPEVGGYYVRYKDGYESYSPAQAFEEGYRLVEPLGTGIGESPVATDLKDINPGKPGKGLESPVEGPCGPWPSETNVTPEKIAAAESILRNILSGGFDIRIQVVPESRDAKLERIAQKIMELMP